MFLQQKRRCIKRSVNTCFKVYCTYWYFPIRMARKMCFIQSLHVLDIMTWHLEMHMNDLVMTLRAYQHHILECFRMCNKSSVMATDGNLYLHCETETLSHLTLTHWWAWLVRQQILQSVSHDCIAIVQISQLIPLSSLSEHSFKASVLCWQVIGCALATFCIRISRIDSHNRSCVVLCCQRVTCL